MPVFPSTGLGDFMGLELTEDVIRANMPEYLPGAPYNANQVSETRSDDDVVG